ncbi:MAG: hypothetical protein QXS05_07070 [Candidatus Bathyarchaeia archaeon]
MGKCDSTLKLIGPKKTNKIVEISRKILFVLIVLLVISLLFVPVIPVTVTYYDEEPYQRLFAYQVVSSGVRWGLDLVRGIYHMMEVKLQNADTRPGTFLGEQVYP